MDQPVPSSLLRDISPPRPPKRRKTSATPIQKQKTSPSSPLADAGPTLSAIEAGKAKVADHLAYFTEHLSKAARPIQDGTPRLSIEDFADLYQRSQHEHGAHFVIHQHNHPISGVHYDLRLQFSKSSSMSFAIPKGLPGNPNSKSLGRMAIETRVHNLWNHLIESASPKTGSQLIWDTGTYTVLPRRMTHHKPPSPQTTDDDSEPGLFSRHTRSTAASLQENEKLIQAFQTKYIRLRLHGTRLPKNYTVALRLPSANDFGNPRLSQLTKRRRRTFRRASRPSSHTTDSEPENDIDASLGPVEDENEQQDLDTDSEEDAETRRTNAYPGSTNSIGSIHQRKWFLQLDRRSSGFVPTGGTWERDGIGGGFENFLVRGRDYERSVITGRLAREVESDEGVEGFVGRGGWVGITT